MSVLYNTLGTPTMGPRWGMQRRVGGQSAVASRLLVTLKLAAVWVAMTMMLATEVLVSVHAKEFRVYWNIPTFHCKQYRLPEVDVGALYGILQNAGDSFRGNRISILYDPGLFPALLANGSATNLYHRNGGVPQAGNYDAHIRLFAQVLDELIPDRNNDGLAIIDFESWRPVYRQNFGTLQPYKTLSVQLQRQQHPAWPRKNLEAAAKWAFETAGRQFMHDTLRLAEQLRPRARWGYYGLPFCFNGKGQSIETCAANIRLENDSNQWLYDASQVIYPSVYMSEKIAAENRGSMVRGRVKESKRLARAGQPVIVYHRYVFTDSGRYLSEADTVAAFWAMQQEGADGVILWGATRDLNNRQKCETFYQYLADVLGPIARRFSTVNFAQDIIPSVNYAVNNGAY